MLEGQRDRLLSAEVWQATAQCQYDVRVGWSWGWKVPCVPRAARCDTLEAAHRCCPCHFVVKRQQKSVMTLAFIVHVTIPSYNLDIRQKPCSCLPRRGRLYLKKCWKDISLQPRGSSVSFSRLPRVIYRLFKLPSVLPPPTSKLSLLSRTFLCCCVVCSGGDWSCSGRRRRWWWA